MSHTVPTSKRWIKTTGSYANDLTVPRDGRLISLILASKGIEDADERVIHQLLDFSRSVYNYLFSLEPTIASRLLCLLVC